MLTGLQSDDQGFAQIGVILAEQLGLPHATIIMEVQAEGGALRVKRELEGGWFQWVAMPLPAVLTIQSGINQLRYATLKGIMAAKKKEIRKAAAPAGLAGEAEDRQPLRAREGQEDAADRRLAGRSGEGAGPQAARGSAGDRMILVIAEQRDGKLNRATLGDDRRRAAARGHRSAAPIAVLVRRRERRRVAAELAAAQVKEVVTVEHAALEPYTPDGFTAALQDAIAQLSPSHVLLPHTYQTRDFAPKLAARLDRALLTDVTGIKTAGGETAFVRPMFQGKLTADVVPQGPAPHFVTFQIGAFRADQAAKGAAPAPVRALSVTRRRVGDSPEARGAVPAGEAGGRSVAGRADRLGRPRHQGAGEHRASRRSSPRRSAPRSPRRVRSATPAGCRWSARSAAPARPSRRSCTSRSASPARFSIWSA